MDEKKLIELIDNKDEDGLVYFIENYAGLMKSVIVRILYKFPYLHEEVLNDSILSVWDNVKYYDNTKSSFKNWCASISRYRAIDALRKEVRHNSLSLEDVDLASNTDESDKIFVEEVLSYLSDEDRELFIALFVEGMTYDELSKEWNVSKNALYSRVKKGRQKLNKEFQGR